MRHGRTGYAHGNARFDSCETAPDDLVPSGVDDVLASARELRALGIAVTRIRSSPMARCLHTARLMRSQLPGNLVVSVEDALREVDCYDRAAFVRAAGQVRGNGSQTTPVLHDEELTEIFFTDELHRKTEVLDEEARAFVKSLESCQTLSQRMLGLLDSGALGDCELLVTHDGLASQLLRGSSNDMTVRRGKFIVVRHHGTSWRVVGTNDDRIKLK